nr:biotin--[acetyl-CoA-carboxylase] ligase [uncultured Altererythrobacter sp.]
MIEVVEQTGSTNADLVNRLRSGESIAESYWLLAKRQSGGRGRSGREWVSPPGNIYTSTVVHVGSLDPPVHTLSLVTGLAVWAFVSDGLMEFQRSKVKLKWPNDVLVDGAKIAGMLLERVGDAIVVGIGVNLAHAPDVPGRKTTCLFDENSRYEAHPEGALPLLAKSFASELAKWREFGTEALMQRWQAAAHPLGSQITAHDPSGEKLSGTFAGLDASGSLLLRDCDGKTRTIHAGDVDLD